MTENTHEDHDHVHRSGCGHTAVRHGDHIDYLHDGHLHRPSDTGAVSECVLEIGPVNPSQCTPAHSCDGHAEDHEHGPDCGHEAVPHGDHLDYLVAGHLHHPHDGHCDDHGPLETVDRAA